MKTALLVCSFDPVTSDEIRYAQNLRKTGGYTDVYLVPSSEGILPYSERLSLLKKALMPYRHLHAQKPCIDTVKVDAGDLEKSEEIVRNGYFRYAPKAIRRVLLDKGFYMDCVVKAQCREKRAVHSRGVAETAEYLAKVHHLDSTKAYVMGMLHDITKKMPDEEGRELIARWKPEWNSISPKVWHSYTAVLFLKREMGCMDSRMLHAIEHHTIGDGKSSYDHILYIADKIEPGRGYDTSRQMSISCRNLAEGAAYILEESRNYIFEKEGIHV